MQGWLTYEHGYAGVQGAAKQGGVSGTQVQQDQDVSLGLCQVQLSEVHQSGTLNDHELDEQQGVVVTHRLQGQVAFCALHSRQRSWERGRKGETGGEKVRQGGGQRGRKAIDT